MQAVYPRQPQETPDMAARKMFDGYDCGVLVADDGVMILNLLADLGVDDETVIMVSSDHGKTWRDECLWGSSN